MPTDHPEASAAHPFHLEAGSDLSALRQALETTGYTKDALAQTVVRHDRTGRLDMSVLLRRTAPSTLYNTLMRVFFLRQAVSATDLRAALAPMSMEQLMTLGLLQQSDTGVRSVAMLLPGEDFVVVHDFSSEITGQPAQAQHVLGVGSASTTLANLTVRRQGETVLDLGTGSGIQSILAARHAAHVVATDLNPRALNFAALNARLNGLTNIEFRQGSLYEPVAAEQFDLIVTNPPFVVSPESRYLYRDSALPGDAISEQVIRGAPAHLREGGYAFVLCNWYHHVEDWSARLRSWVADTGCDAWLLCFRTHDPLSYASNWLRPTEDYDLAHYDRLLDTWLQYYEHMGIHAISYGAVILRRRTAPHNWLHADTVVSGQGAGSCSTQIQRIFAARDVLAELQDERQLLDYALVLAPDHQLEHVLKADDGGWTVTEAVLKQEQGLQFTGQVDRLVSTVLAGCNGQHLLRALVADVAQGLGVPVEAVVPACLRVMLQLLQTGFLSIARR